MRWTPGGDSSDIEDRRGEGGGGGFNFGGFNGMHLGIGGTLVLIVLSFLFRTNLFTVLGGGDTAPTAARPRQIRMAARRTARS
jgi:predicted metalloprotease